MTGGLHSEVTVTVNVTDVAEAPAFAEGSYAFSLAENADGGAASVALGAVSATDPENSTITYSIEAGDSGGLFAIDPGTGALSYQGAGEDYESGTTRYELTVRASDGGLHSEVTVTVNVTDVAEAQEVTETQQSVSEPDGQDLPDGVSTTGRLRWAARRRARSMYLTTTTGSPSSSRRAVPTGSTWKARGPGAAP